MISVTFNGNPAFLLNDAPDWATPLTLAATMPASYERSLTGKETRRQTGDTLRLEVKLLRFRLGMCKVHGIVKVDHEVACEADIMFALTNTDPATNGSKV